MLGKMYRKNDRVIYIFHDALYNAKGTVVGKKSTEKNCTWVKFDKTPHQPQLIINEALQLHKEIEY